MFTDWRTYTIAKELKEYKGIWLEKFEE